MGKIWRFVGVVGIVVGIAGLVGCGDRQNTSADSSQAKRLYLYNWTYYIPDEVIEAFEEEFGVDVVYDMYASNEEMFAKLKAGGTGYDIVVPSGDYVSIMVTEGMLEPIDRSKLPNFGLLDPDVLSRIRFDAGNRYSVPYMMGAAGIAVNNTRVSEYDAGWTIFAREDLRNRMTMLDDMREVLGGALITLGYSVNTTDESELAAAKEVVLGWRENLLRFDAEAFGKAFASEEIWVAHGYQENILLEMDEADHHKVDYFIPREGSSMYMDSMVILQDARNKDTAYEFINYLLRPQVHAVIADYLALPTIVLGADEFTQSEPTYTLADLGNSEFKEDVGPAIRAYNRIWQEIRVGR